MTFSVSKKTFARLIAVIVVLTVSLIFFIADRGEQKEMEQSLNETYTEYKESPDDFIVADAEIIEEFDCDTGARLKFFSATNQWLVLVKLDEKNTCEACVMRDVEKEHVGDTIKVAYKKSQTDYSKDNMNATQLKYIEETSVMKSYFIVILLNSILLAGIVIYTAVCVIKNGRK